VTNGGCNPTSACDFGADTNRQSTFVCYDPPPPNTAGICASCDDKTVACLGGFTCLYGQCARYCCDDGDCGTGVCDPTNAFGVGVCVTAVSVDGGMPAPACDAPATSPSLGKCVTVADGGSPADGGTPADGGPSADGGPPPADAGGG
jgi:hypothetical protein